MLAVFERKLARLAAVQVESLGEAEEVTIYKSLDSRYAIELATLATVQVESLGKQEAEEVTNYKSLDSRIITVN